MAVVELIEDVEDYSKRDSRLGERQRMESKRHRMLFTWQVGAAIF